MFLATDTIQANGLRSNFILATIIGSQKLLKENKRRRINILQRHIWLTFIKKCSSERIYFNLWQSSFCLSIKFEIWTDGL